MFEEIIRISIILWKGCEKNWDVGWPIGSIVDKSTDKDFIYEVRDDWENPINKIINCPVVITYKKL